MELKHFHFYFSCAEEAIQLIQSTGNDLDTFPVLLLMGKLYFQLQNFDKALMSVLRATRLKPHSSECFYYLGKIYYASNDILRSRKCFEKCVTLNPLNEKAVENLSAIYQLLEEEVNVGSFLKWIFP